jgi:hypothetical protein
LNLPLPRSGGLEGEVDGGESTMAASYVQRKLKSKTVVWKEMDIERWSDSSGEDKNIEGDPMRLPQEGNPIYGRKRRLFCCVRGMYPDVF